MKIWEFSRDNLYFIGSGRNNVLILVVLGGIFIGYKGFLVFVGGDSEQIIYMPGVQIVRGNAIAKADGGANAFRMGRGWVYIYAQNVPGMEVKK